jgi:hypothetical protein
MNDRNNRVVIHTANTALCKIGKDGRHKVPDLATSEL